ncbi:MAG: carbohydrate porin [Pseudomonadota bacterium]
MISRGVLAGVALCALVGGADGASADDTLAAWLAQDTATGDWGGARSALKKEGVTPEANYTTDLLANPIGGLSHGEAYAAVLYGSLEFDLGTLAGLQGLSLYAAGSWSDGRDLSADDIGNIFTASQIFTGNDVRLSALFLEQSLWHDSVNIALGRITTGATFAAATVFDYYVGGAINGNPESFDINIPSYTEDPFSQWGVRVTLHPRKDLYLSLAAYNADPSVQDDGSHGVDFTFNPSDGVLAIAQVGLRPDLGDSHNGGPLPGHYALGAYFDSSDFTRLDDPLRRRDGNYGFYAMAEQLIYREDTQSRQGLTPWAILTVAPLESVNTLPFAAYGGLVYEGLIPERDRDITALGLYYGLFSDDLPDQSYELVLELNHRLQLAPWFYITPDFQYVFNPGGTGEIDDAAVFGIEISIDF